MSRREINTPKIFPTIIYSSIFPEDKKNHARWVNLLPLPKEKNRKEKEQEKIRSAFFGPYLIAEGDRAQFRQALRVLGAKDLETILYGSSSEEKVEASAYPFPKDEEIGAIFDTLEAQHGFFEHKEEERLEFIKLFKTAKMIGDFIEKNNTPDNSVAAQHAYKILVVFGQERRVQKKAEQVEKKEEKETKTDKKEKANAAVSITKEPLKAMEEYLQMNGQQMQRPLHDILQHPLPVGPDIRTKIHLSAWRKLIQANGRKKAFKYFANAEKIEAQLSTMDEAGKEKKEEEEKKFSTSSKGVKRFRAPKTLEEIQLAHAKCSFKRSDENIELAKLSKEWPVTEQDFNECLAILAKRGEEEKREHKPYKNTLPSVEIQGVPFNEDANATGFYLVKLPEDDLNAFFLGHITDCCQHIGGHSKQCVIDGMTLKNNGFYVLLEAKGGAASDKKPLDEKGHINYEHFDIVGQCYAFRTTNDNLVLDSWENKNPARHDKIAAEMIKRFAKTIVDEKKNNIGRVTIGKGGKTPSAFRTLPDTEAESIFEGEQYGDSSKQAEVYVNQTRRRLLQPKLDGLVRSIDADVKIHPEEKKALITWLQKSCYTSDFIDTMQFFYEQVPGFFTKHYKYIRNKNFPLLLLLFDARLIENPVLFEKVFKPFPQLKEAQEVAKAAREENVFAEPKLFDAIAKANNFQKMVEMVKEISKALKICKEEKIGTEGIIALGVAKGVFSKKHSSDSDKYLSVIPKYVFDQLKKEISDSKECIALTNQFMMAMAYFLNVKSSDFLYLCNIEVFNRFKTVVEIRDITTSIQYLEREAKGISFLPGKIDSMRDLIVSASYVRLLKTNGIEVIDDITRHLSDEKDVTNMIAYFKNLREKDLDIPSMHPPKMWSNWSFEEGMRRIAAMDLMREEKITEDPNLRVMLEISLDKIKDIINEFKQEKAKLSSLSTATMRTEAVRDAELLKGIVVKQLLTESSFTIFNLARGAGYNKEAARQVALLITQDPLLRQKVLDVSKELPGVTDPLLLIYDTHPDLLELAAIIKERNTPRSHAKKTKQVDKKSIASSSSSPKKKSRKAQAKDTGSHAAIMGLLSSETGAGTAQATTASAAVRGGASSSSSTAGTTAGAAMSPSSGAGSHASMAETPATRDALIEHSLVMRSLTKSDNENLVFASLAPTM